MTDIVVPLRSRRRERALLVQQLQDLIPAGALLSQGIHGLRGGATGAAGLTLATAEALVGALMLRSLFFAVRAVRRGEDAGEAAPHAIDWNDILAAAMLSLQAMHQWYTHQHVTRPAIALAIVTLILGLLHGRIGDRGRRRRALRINDEFMVIGGRPFRRFKRAWADIDRIDIEDREARVVARDGRVRRLKLDDLLDRERVVEALRAARSILGGTAGVATET